MVFRPLLSNGRSRVGAIKKRTCRRNALKHSYLQWNAGTACVSECVLKTPACRGLQVGPSKKQTWKLVKVQKNIRTNNSEQFRAPHMKMWGLKARSLGALKRTELR